MITNGAHSPAVPAGAAAMAPNGDHRQGGRDEAGRLPRGLTGRLSRAVARWPVVVVEGARGVGKTQLAAELVRAGHAAELISMADLVVARRARDDLDGFVATLPRRSVIDDAHLVPELADALVAAAERCSDPGQFVIVSASGAFAPHLLRSAAVHLLRLRPFTQAEFAGGTGGFIDAAQSTDPTTWAFEAQTPAEYLTRAVLGGQPVAATLSTEERVQLYLDQARLSLAGFGDLHGAELFDGLTEIATSRRAALAPAAASGDADLPPAGSSLDPDHDTLAVLGLARVLRRWSSGVPGRGPARQLLTDSGLHNALAIAAVGHAVEDSHGHREHAVHGPSPDRLIVTMAVNEILTQNEWRRYPATPWRWESRAGSLEIDLLLEDQSGGIVALAVDPSAELGGTAPTALEAFARRYPKAFRRGFVLYGGSRVLRLGENRWAVPLSALWANQAITPIADIGSLETELSAAAAALTRLLRTPKVSDAELDRRAAEVLSAVHQVVNPKLLAVRRAVEQVGLAVESVDHDGLATVIGPLLAEATEAPAREPIACGLHIGSPPGPTWTAVVAGFVQPDGQAQWWVGHIESSGQAVRVGPTVVASQLADETADRLVAALAASLTDAYARFS